MEGGGNTIAKHFGSAVPVGDHLTSAARDEKGAHIQCQGGRRESRRMNQTHQRISQLHEAQRATELFCRPADTQHTSFQINSRQCILLMVKAQTRTTKHVAQGKRIKSDSGDEHTRSLLAMPSVP